MLVNFGSSPYDFNLPWRLIFVLSSTLRLFSPGRLPGGGPEGFISGLPWLVLASKVLLEPLPQPRYLRVGRAALAWLRLYWFVFRLVVLPRRPFSGWLPSLRPIRVAVPLLPFPISPGGREGGRLTPSGAGSTLFFGTPRFSWSRVPMGPEFGPFQPAFGVGCGAIPAFGPTSLTTYVRGFGAPLTSLSGGPNGPVSGPAFCPGDVSLQGCRG